ncbi:hypothetical protein LIA77_05480 [Sarocladium implicatum]|nr:hypothetical protein LIA77_05480 [Sarocladium implicatum]
MLFIARKRNPPGRDGGLVIGRTGEKVDDLTGGLPPERERCHACRLSLHRLMVGRCGEGPTRALERAGWRQAMVDLLRSDGCVAVWGNWMISLLLALARFLWERAIRPFNRQHQRRHCLGMM